MKKTPFPIKRLIFLLLSLAWLGCKKPGTEKPSPPVPPVDTTVTHPVPGKLPEKNISCNIQGQVLNENGQPFSGVTIDAGGATAVTDRYGFFRFDNILINQNGGMVRATKAGYFAGIKNLFYKEKTTNYLSIQLIPKHLAGTFNAGSGGTVGIKDAAIEFPANSLVIVSGNQSYTGDVNVYAAYSGVGDQDLLRQIPGNLFSVPSDNTVAALENYGLLAVELQTADGEPLQLAQGREATLRMPAPAGAPAALSFYSFDESTGFWNEEVKAVRSGEVYVGKVSHFSFWSPDVPFPVVDMEVTFEDQHHHPLVNQLVVIARSGVANFVAGYALTDSSGHVWGKVPANEQLLLAMYNGCLNSIFSKNIGPFSAAANLGVLQVGSNLSWITVSGKLIDCNTAPVSNGLAIVDIEGIVYRSAVDKNGNFSMDILNCSTGGLASISGMDITHAKQSNPVIITLNAPVINAGALYACSGMSNESFFSYSIDSTSYTYTMPGYVYGEYVSENTSITGTDDLVWYPNGGYFSIQGPSRPGSYPLFVFNHQFVRNAMILISTNTMVEITDYGEINQFITGHFSDTLLEVNSYDDTKIPHIVNCVFRVKRTK